MHTGWLSRAVILVGFLPSFGAAYRTDNFIVDAPTAELAKQFGQAAEQHRKEQALAWLGKELPAWVDRCPIQVKITLSGANGCSSFTYDRGKVVRQSMTLEGAAERLLGSVLPHETTHLIFAHYFGRPVTRWADEGGAALAEPLANRRRTDAIACEIVNTPGRTIALRRLLPLRDYPGDVTALYAQGYSLARFLVDGRGGPAFMAFVAQGMQSNDWDAAVKAHYGYRSVEELEAAWLREQKASGESRAESGRATVSAKPDKERREGDVPAEPIAPVPPARPGPRPPEGSVLQS
jgi:hypothetical protein